MRLSPSTAILRTQSDERLVALARGGSQNAFQAIVERYRRSLQRASCRVLSESRAEDTVQQAFIAAWLALQRGDEVVNLRAWLLRIARNSALNALRVPGYDFAELRVSLVSGVAPQEELERREVMRQTLAGLAALPERQREALLRSAVEGVPYADIAHDLGLSEGAARQLVLRARVAMRASASALVPWPLMQRIALHGRADATARIVEIAAAGGGAGATGLLAKASVAVVAGSGVIAPAAMQDRPPVASPASIATRPAPSSAISARRPVVAARTPPSAATGASRGAARRDPGPRDPDRSSGRDDAAADGRRSDQNAGGDEPDDGAADVGRGSGLGTRADGDGESGDALGGPSGADRMTSDPVLPAEVADGADARDGSGRGSLDDGDASEAPQPVASDE